MEISPAIFAERYLLECSIGSGSLGEVFQAWDTQLQRRVAIKRFAAVDLDGQDAHVAAWQEAIHLAAIHHPNIVSIYDLGSDEAGPFVIMELVEGETLEDVVTRGAFPLVDFQALARQALEGLAAAHQVNLLHHDLKPGNIMLSRGPTGLLQVKLLDFGLSKPSFESIAPTARGEEAATVLGTIEFLPPEVFERQPFEARGDLYALGCIFYYALAGCCPFRGVTASEVVASHLEGRVTPLETVRRDLPVPLCAWVMRLISRQPAQRPATACEAIKELDQLVEEESPTVAPPTGHRKKWLAAAGGLGLLTLVGALGMGNFLQQTISVEPVAKTEKPIFPPPAGVRVQRTVVAPTTGGEATVYRADDLAALRPMLGESVTVEGKAAALRRDPQTGAPQLNFADDPAQAVSLVFPPENSPGNVTPHNLEDYLNRTVRASGQLTEHAGSWQIAIERTGQVEMR